MGRRMTRLECITDVGREAGMVWTRDKKGRSSHHQSTSGRKIKKAAENKAEEWGGGGNLEEEDDGRGCNGQPDVEENKIQLLWKVPSPDDKDNSGRKRRSST